jgi:hypothetical protein
MQALIDFLRCLMCRARRSYLVRVSILGMVQMSARGSAMVMRRRAVVAMLAALPVLVGSIIAPAQAGAGEPDSLPVMSKWEPWRLAVLDDGLPPRLKKYGDLYRAKARVTADDTALLIIYRLRDAARLSRSSGAFQMVSASITRGRTDYTFGALTAEPGRPFAHSFTDAPDSEEQQGPEIECRGHRVRVDYGNNVLRQRIPLRCFGSPARVVLGASVSVAYQPPGNGIYDIRTGFDLVFFGAVLL